MWCMLSPLHSYPLCSTSACQSFRISLHCPSLSRFNLIFSLNLYVPTTMNEAYPFSIVNPTQSFWMLHLAAHWHGVIDELPLISMVRAQLGGFLSVTLLYSLKMAASIARTKQGIRIRLFMILTDQVSEWAKKS